ncbi:MAG: hypothetical protein HC819_24005 [Cyclobacteriaceae bacterium]|nr:hypothetical protein [Cyclobacteriaceae bacterium]
MNKYNPNIHNRRSIRLRGHDYSQAGMYFVTICCQDRACRLGKIENDRMILNECGNIAYAEWLKLTERFSNFELDVFQIMPNHMHGINALNDVSVGATLAVAPNTVAPNNANIRSEASPAPTKTIGDIVGAYKSLVANGCLDIYKSKNKTMGKLWQRNYHEHIIRNERSYQRISEYIYNDPSK